MTSIPEVRGFTKEVRDRLKEIGDIEYLDCGWLYNDKWAVKTPTGFRIVDSYDSAAIISEIVTKKGEKN